MAGSSPPLGSLSRVLPASPAATASARVRPTLPPLAISPPFWRGGPWVRASSGPGLLPESTRRRSRLPLSEPREPFLPCVGGESIPSFHFSPRCGWRKGGVSGGLEPKWHRRASMRHFCKYINAQLQERSEDQQNHFDPMSLTCDSCAFNRSICRPSGNAQRPQRGNLTTSLEEKRSATSANSFGS